MKQPPIVDSLATLVELRAREMDQLKAVIATKAAVRQRYLNNLERLAGLCADAGSEALPPALSLNRANYKDAVLQMADSHRTDLALHDADMAVTQRALGAAWCRHAVLGQVLAQQHLRLDQARQKTERKHQDELAMQMWHRGTAR